MPSNFEFVSSSIVCWWILRLTSSFWSSLRVRRAKNNNAPQAIHFMDKNIEFRLRVHFISARDSNVQLG